MSQPTSNPSHRVPMTRRPTILVSLAIAAGGLGVLALRPWRVTGAEPSATSPPATRPGTAPAAAVATLSGDWPGFHGGGALRGEGRAIPAGTLTPRWTYKTGDEERASVEASAAIVGDTVYVGDLKGVLHALRVSDGQRKWIYKAGDGFGTTPLVAGGKVFIGDMAGTFHCVSAADGAKLWTFDAGNSIHSSANLAGTGAGEGVVFGTDGADIFCLATSDGSKRWEAKTGDRVNGAPGIGWGATFVSGCDAKLRAIDVAGGAERFAADIGSLCPGSPAILDDRLVMGLDGGRVVCMSSDGQKQLWEYEGVEDDAMVYASPAAADGIVVTGARDRNVHAFAAADGKPLWKFATRGDVDSSPAISGGRVYVGSKDKKLYVLDLKTGAKLGEFTTGRSILAGPAIGAGVVVIGDTAGNVYCLEPK